MKTVGISIAEIEDLLGLEVSGDERIFKQLSSYKDASSCSIVFATNEEALEKARASDAGLILTPLHTPPDADSRLLRVGDPKFAFAVIGLKMLGDPDGKIHHSAVVAAGAKVGHGSSLGAGCVVEEGAEIGQRCLIGSNVTIYGNVIMGDNVVVQAGAVLGAMGFGYVRGNDGRYVRFPQQGRLVIDDDVEIGANTTIDRGALGETRIGHGTKIDNLVHIGHNCQIGKNVVIAAQVGISGSCVVEDGAVLAGQVGLSDHVTIGRGVILGGAAGVFSYKRVDGPGEVFMGVPAEPLKDHLKAIARIRRLK